MRLNHGNTFAAAALACAALLLSLAACGQKVVWAGPAGDAGRPANPDGLASEAGYYQIEPIEYSFRPNGGQEKHYKSIPQRLFYSYHPAAAEARSAGPAPLFVMLNGGPGCATMSNLFSMNTAPYTMDRERVGASGRPYARNPYSWTVMGNLLYIDAPDTGFSYALAEDPSGALTRLSGFGLPNFNPFIDAGQVLRLVLRFVEEHPALKKNQVIFVGESYAGVRVTTMLNYLLFHAEYRDGKRFYRDLALSAEIERCLAGLGPGAWDPRQVAAKFPGQVFIEPQLTGAYQDDATEELFYGPDSVIDKLAAETGKKDWRPAFLLPFANKARHVTDEVVPKQMNRDPYWYDKPAPWGDELEAFTLATLLDVDALSTVLNYDARRIEWLKPEQRRHAFRYPPFLEWDKNDKVKKNPKALFGPLKPWDEYQVTTNPGVWASFFYSPDNIFGFQETNPDESRLFGEMLLYNLPFVRTFLTDADLDLIIYPPAIPRSLEMYADLVAKVEVRKEDAAKPGSGLMRVSYKAGAPKGHETPAFVDIEFPRYAKSGHSVSSAEPEKLLADVRRWLGGIRAGKL